MKTKLTVSELLFYLAYIIWIVAAILQQTRYVDMLNIIVAMRAIRIVVYSLLISKIIYNNSYSIKSIFMFGTIGFILIIVTFYSDKLMLLDTFLFIYCARNLSIRQIIKVTLFIQVILMLFIILSSCSGIIQNDLWYREDGKIRYGLGYNYCTFAANYYFHMVLMYIYLKEEKKLKLKEVIVILCINYIIYIFTDTRAVFYLICGMIILAYNIRFFKSSLKNGIINKLAFKYCVPISAMVSIFGSINYNSSNIIYVTLNHLLSGRLKLGRTAYEEFGVSLFGQKIGWVTGRAGIERGFDEIYNYVDSSYLNIALSYGLIVIILLCVGFVFIGKRAIENNDKYFCLVLMFLAIHSMTDPQLIELKYNPFILTFGMFFNVSLKKLHFKKLKIMPV